MVTFKEALEEIPTVSRNSLYDVISEFTRKNVFVINVDGKIVTQDNILKILSSKLSFKKIKEAKCQEQTNLPVVNIKSGLRRVIVKMLRERTKYVLVKDRGEIIGVISPRSLFRALLRGVYESDMRNILRRYGGKFFAPNTTVIGVIKRLDKHGVLCGVSRYKGRFRGIVTTTALFKYLLEVLEKGFGEGFYYESSLADIKLDTNAIIIYPQEDFTKFINILSEKGFGAILNEKMNIIHFIDDKGLLNYSIEILSRRVF